MINSNQHIKTFLLYLGFLGSLLLYLPQIINNSSNYEIVRLLNIFTFVLLLIYLLYENKNLYFPKIIKSIIFLFILKSPYSILNNFI